MSYSINTDLSDVAWMERIGHFIKTHRLRQNRSQVEVARAAGLSRSTLSLLERGQTVRLDSLIQVLRVLDLLYVLEAFHIEDEIGPVAYAKMKRKERQRASPDTVAEDRLLTW